jgi:hypothetical protein
MPGERAAQGRRRLGCIALQAPHAPGKLPGLHQGHGPEDRAAQEREEVDDLEDSPTCSPVKAVSSRPSRPARAKRSCIRAGWAAASLTMTRSRSE